MKIQHHYVTLSGTTNVSPETFDSREIIDSFPDGVVVHDVETGIIKRVNDTFCDMVEYEREPLVGANIGVVDAGPRSNQSDAVSGLLDKARTDGSVTFEWCYETQTGESFPVEVHLSTLTDKESIVATVREITDRKDRQHRRRSYKRLVEQAPDMMVGLDPDGTLLFANAEFRQTHDIEKESVTGLAVKDLLSTDWRQELRPILDCVLAGEAVDRTVHKPITDGDDQWFHIYSYPIKHRGEQCDSVVVTIKDISERKHHQQTIQDQQAFIESAINALDDVFYVVDTEGVLIEYNDRLSEVTGYGPEELDEMQPWDLFPSDERAPLKHAISDILDNESNERFEGHLLTSSGETIPYEFSSAPFYDGGGEVAGFVGVGRDITERREREATLTRFKQAIEQTGHAVCFTDTNGTIEYVNPAFEDLTGYSLEEARGETPRLLQSGEHDNVFYEEMWEQITAGEVWEGMITDQRKSGTMYRAHQTIAPVTHEGTTLGFVAVQDEITSKQLQKEHMSVLHRILRHNLRNYLNVIYARADFLDRVLTDDSQRAHVRKITEQAEKLETLSEQIQAGKETLEHLSPPFSTVPVNELYDDITSSLGDVATSATMALDYPAEQPVYVPERLKLALRELLENALKHTEHVSPSITTRVRVDEERDQVSITVEDDGSSIPEIVCETLQQGEETDLRHLTGVGLWLVKWIVTALGGTLNIDTADVSGSRVTITTPFASSQKPMSL